MFHGFLLNYVCLFVCFFFLIFFLIFIFRLCLFVVFKFVYFSHLMYLFNFEVILFHDQFVLK